MEQIKKFWSRWKAMGQWLGDAIARVILTFFYITIIPVFAALVQLFTDPLDSKSAGHRAWTARTTRQDTLQSARKQF